MSFTKVYLGPSQISIIELFTKIDKGLSHFLFSQIVSLNASAFPPSENCVNVVLENNSSENFIKFPHKIFNDETHS